MLVLLMRCLFIGLTRFVDTMATTFSYEPMAHSTRQNDIQMLASGGKIGLISELKYLFEDCQIVNPNTMAGVPRVWNKLYSEYNEALSVAITGQPKEVSYITNLGSGKEFKLNGEIFVIKLR